MKKFFVFMMLVSPCEAKQFGFDIPDSIYDEVIFATSIKEGYREELMDPKTGRMVPNPQTMEQFLISKFKRYFENTTWNHQKKAVGDVAIDAAKSEIEGRIQIP